MTQPNKVRLTNEGIVEIFVRGDQTVVSVQEMGEEAMRLCREQRSSHLPALILDNLVAIGTVPPEARQQVAQLIKSSDFDKLAMLGSGSLIKIGANLILQATGRGKRVKYFDSREQALVWLKA